jgi:hypothetical protein
MQSAPDAAKELERCVKQLGFHGSLINGHTQGRERVADLNVPIYIHPTLAWQTPRNYQDHRELGAAIWGWAPETTGTLSSPEDTVLIPLNLLTAGWLRFRRSDSAEAPMRPARLSPPEGSIRSSDSSMEPDPRRCF